MTANAEVYHTWSMTRKGLGARRVATHYSEDEAIQSIPLDSTYVYVQRWIDGECCIVWDNLGGYRPVDPECVRRLIRRPQKVNCLPAPTHIRNWREIA